MPRLLAGLAHYVMNRKFIKPSTCRLALNRSAVVLIGAGRGGVGRNNGTRLAKDHSANFACNGHS
jgi:hypothetical protein